MNNSIFLKIRLKTIDMLKQEDIRASKQLICHVTRLEPSQAEPSEPSRIGAEPSRELRDRI
jgi:hypothetical protein